MASKPFSFEEFINIYSKVPRICVDLVIETKKGILLTKRAINPWKGFWHTPGGTVLLNEKLEHTVKRVAKEELNIAVSIEKMLGVLEFFYDFKNYSTHDISVVFLVRPKSGDIKLDKQADEWKVFRTLPKKMITLHRRFLKEKLKIH